jgi:hypothetical protein
MVKKTRIDRKIFMMRIKVLFMSSTTEAEGHRETSPDRRPAPQLVETGAEGVNCAVTAILAGAAQLRVAVSSMQLLVYRTIFVITEITLGMQGHTLG